MKEPKIYRKKPIKIRAIRWTGDNYSVMTGFCGAEITVCFERRPNDYYCPHCNESAPKHLKIKTLEGDLIACPGDMIIEGVEGENYPCKPQIFNKTYELMG